MVYAALGARRGPRFSFCPGVAAADSFVSPLRLLELERVGRLRRPHDPDGVIPGEAAACLLLDRYPERALASLGAPGFGLEPATLWNDEPHRGNGLLEAATNALAACGYDLASLDMVKAAEKAIAKNLCGCCKKPKHATGEPMSRDEWNEADIEARANENMGLLSRPISTSAGLARRRRSS